jgi:hypothetical protein
MSTNVVTSFWYRVVIVNKDEMKARRDVLIPNDVVNVVDTVCWPIYIPHR